jgi:hypothetical protein
LQPFRHGLEMLPGQVGAAYFIAGRLAGVEAAPNPAYWQDLAPVLAIYGYGPAAVRALDSGLAEPLPCLDVDGLANVDGLAARLETARRRQQDLLCKQVRQEVDALEAGWTADEVRHGLRVHTLLAERWAGQVVREQDDLVYLSLFADVFA